MKKALVVFAFVSLAVAPSLYAAQAGSGAAPASKTAPAKTTGTTQAPAHHGGKTHTVHAEFVSYDAATKQVTVKDEKGQTSTAPLKGKAVGEAAHLKAGDKVMLTCHDNEKGEHESVSAIKPAAGKM